MLTTSATYRMLTRDIDTTLERTAEEKPVALETAYYLQHIGDVKSIDDLIKDTRLFRYAMKAFGLEDMSNAKAFMRKVLNEGITDPNSFANRLADDRFVRFAQTFDFKGKGEDVTASVDAQQGVADRYVRQTLETSEGEDNEGVRLALYFAREAPNVSSAYGLLGDPALWQVAKTVFGFPDEMANADIDKQAQAVNARLNIADLRDPTKLNALITRFTAVYDATTDTQSDPVLLLFDNSGQGTASLDLDLLTTLSNLKHGGS